MTKRVLCDTNVWLDYYFGTRTRHDEARELVMLCCRRDVALMVPSSCLGDFFYLCQAGFKQALHKTCGRITQSQALAAQASAWANVEHLLELATVVGSDHGDAHIATKHRVIHGDFEDDLVIAAALRANADCLVTNNEQLRRNSPVLTLSSGEAVAFLNADEAD